MNDLLLQTNELRENNNELIRNARISLGARIVTYILGLPFDRLGVLGDLLQRYFDNVISKELINGAKNFMQRVWAVRQKIQYMMDQIVVVRIALERAAKELEIARKELEECEARGEKSK